MADFDLTHLCRLAQLALTDAEQTAVRHDLTRIIDMVDRMQAVDTEGVEPLAHPLGHAARLRPDQASAKVDRDRYQNLAPVTQDGFYLVPRVVE
jgi:aspartyl-tRNA(Asn)/glutamyl-tRNA(Gln) amidotransferase subunit C